MKTMKVFLICFSMAFTPLAFAQVENLSEGMEDAGDIDATPPPARPGASSQTAQAGQQQGGQTCAQLKMTVDPKCANNQLLIDAQQKSGIISGMMQGLQFGGGSQLAETGQSEASAGIQSLSQAKQECEQHNNNCKNQCTAELNQAAASNNTSKVNSANENMRYCQNSHQAAMAKQAASMGPLKDLLSVAGMILMALGKGGSDGGGGLTGPNLNSSETDPCKGLYGDVLITCQKDNGIDEDPLNPSSRGGLTGTGTGALSGDPTAGLFNTSSQGEPGGTAKGSGNKGFGGGSGGGSGMGAFGASGLGSSGLGSAAAGESGLNSDIHKGYMSGGSGSGGGDGGGGSSGGGSKGGFAASGLDPSGAPLNSDLNDKLNKLAKVDKRGLASADGKVGALQSLWDEVTKAYKNNSKTMIDPQSGPR